MLENVNIDGHALTQVIFLELPQSIPSVYVPMAGAGYTEVRLDSP
jgi:hypothetical protein